MLRTFSEEAATIAADNPDGAVAALLNSTDACATKAHRALEELDHYIQVHDPACMWPVSEYNTFRRHHGYRFCGLYPAGDGAKFCHRHEEVVVRHVVSEVLTGREVAALDSLMEAIYEGVRTRDTRSDRDRRWSDWIDREVVERLRNGDLSDEAFGRVVEAVEDGIAERWSREAIRTRFEGVGTAGQTAWLYA